MWHKIWECQYDSKALTQLKMNLDPTDKDYDKWCKIIEYYIRSNYWDEIRKELERTYGIIL